MQTFVHQLFRPDLAQYFRQLRVLLCGYGARDVVTNNLHTKRSAANTEDLLTALNPFPSIFDGKIRCDKIQDLEIE